MIKHEINGIMNFDIAEIQKIHSIYTKYHDEKQLKI